MSRFDQLAPSALPRPDLRLVVDQPKARSRYRSCDLVSLRCVAGQAFTKATGLAHDPHLSPRQLHFGGLGVIDRTGPMGVYPPFERF